MDRARGGQSRAVEGSPGKAEASLTVPAEPAAAARARAFLARTLEQAGVEEERRFEALLVTSELVTNAVCHGSRSGDEIAVDVSLEGRRLRIGVTDAARGPTTPVAARSDEQQLSGRGLALVDWLAEWSERIVDGRREVRAELTL
jgi:anti-sigma regulatory factor (Ser/Thr protein kinase)